MLIFCFKISIQCEAQKFAVLLNGNMRTPKIEALYRLIDWLNAKSNSDFNLPKLGLDESSLDSNSWLAGFIESDGNFYCGFEMGEDNIAKSSFKERESFYERFFPWIACDAFFHNYWCH